MRDCRQLAPDRIHVAGRAWADTFADILDRATVGLGCPEGAVAAELYKLLIYEPGGFFKPHRDTEKADGMVATLVISLPVPGAGGELVIRHRGRETVVDMRTDEPSELVYAAFYADCEHEILPVTDGHRVCLVYNLMLQDGGATPLEAPDYDAEIDRIAAELGARCRDPDASGKLVWLLEHDYSAAGLSFGTLKNVDAAIGRVLMTAAERAGCALHAAIVRVEETGSGWYGGYADVVEDITDREFELYDIVEVACWLDGWARPDGTPADYGALPLLPGELMPAGRLDPERPDSQRLFEASGNEGATIERLYRRAALIVWPKADSARLLAQAGAGSLAAFLAGEWQRASEGAPTCIPIRDLASQVVDLWPSRDSHRRRSDGDSWEGHSARTLELLCSIGNREASARFLSDVVLPNYDGEMNAALVTAAAEMGVGEMREFLCALAGSRTSQRPEGIVDLASRLCERLDDGRDGAWHDALREMAATVCAQMPSVQRPLDRDDPVDWYRRTARFPLSWRRWARSTDNRSGPAPPCTRSGFTARASCCRAAGSGPLRRRTGSSRPKACHATASIVPRFAGSVWILPPRLFACRSARNSGGTCGFRSSRVGSTFAARPRGAAGRTRLCASRPAVHSRGGFGNTKRTSPRCAACWKRPGPLRVPPTPREHFATRLCDPTEREARRSEGQYRFHGAAVRQVSKSGDAQR